MTDPSPFKWGHFRADVLRCAVRWYLRCGLSYRDVEELMQACGVRVDHPTVYRWVQRYAPGSDKCCRLYLRVTNALEQDHRFVKRRVNAGLEFWTFATAQQIIQGYEAMQGPAKVNLRGWPRAKSSPTTVSSSNCSSWPHNGISPASPHAPMSFCNTTRRVKNRGATLAARFDPGVDVHQGYDVDLAADS